MVDKMFFVLHFWPNILIYLKVLSQTF